MKKNRIMKIVLYSISGVMLLAIVLMAHIYMAYRHKAPDANTRVMARIDVKQQLSETDSCNITAWLYRQKGIDHVLVNPHSNIVVFTFFPVKESANQIVSDFKANFNLKAERFVPTADNLKHSCPMAATSFTYKVYKFIDRII